MREIDHSLKMPNQEESKKESSIYKSPKVLIYISLQYILFLGLLLTGPTVPSNPILIFFEIIGIWYLVWVLWTNFVLKFDLSYRPVSKARLVAKGPYKYIRHPFSTALILISLVLIINNFDLLRFVLWALLIVVIVLKTRYEETIFSRFFNDFSLYRQRTYRLIPFIY